MPKHLSAFLVLTFLVGSCAPAPTPPPTVTATQTVPPAPTPSATPTSMPQTQEHLIVTRDLEHWAVLNADGSLQKYIQTPDIASPSGVSPDGNWLAYEFGSYEKEPYDLSLNLLNLDDGTSQFVTNLLSSDFPENLEPIVKTISQYDPSLYGEDCNTIACRQSLVKEEVAISAGISSWSPDGQWLAFAAQIDGPSTDIYIYNMQDKSTRRLTDDLQNIYRVEWSPDGKRILYTNTIPGTDFDKGNFHITDIQGKTFEITQEILAKEPEWYMHGWISDHLYLLQALRPEPGQEHFRQLVVLNTENGQTTEIWSYPTDTVAIDTINQRIMLSFIQYSFDDPIPDAPEDGTYFVSTNGDRKKVSDQVFYYIVSSSQFIGTDERIAYHILQDGFIERIGPTDSGLTNSASPDSRWFFIYEGDRDEHYRFSLYDTTYQRTKSWVLDEDILDTSWRPDSLGIFLFTENNIYYLAIPDGEPQLLNVQVPPWSCEVCNDIAYKWPKFAWRP